MIKLSLFFKTRRGFTMLETLMALTAFTMVISSYVKYTSSQNQQVTTMVQHSQASEATTMVIQYLSGDIKSARRGEIFISTPAGPLLTPCVKISSNGQTISIFRFLENPDIKSADKISMEKVECVYNSTTREFTRSVYKVNFAKTFKKDDKIFEMYTVGDLKSKNNPVKNVEAIKLKRIPIPGMESSSHTMAVGIEVESKMANILIPDAQKSKNQDIIYIKDEVAYKNQPNWNVNPVFTKEIVGVTLSPPEKIDFASAADGLAWVMNFKNGIPAMLEDAKKELIEKLMAAATDKVLEHADELYSKFINDSQIQNMSALLNKKFANAMYEAAEAGKKSGVGIAAALIGDYVGAAGNQAEVIKNKILNKMLTNADIEELIKNHNNDFKKFGINVDYFNDFRNNVANATDQAKYLAIIDNVRNNVYNGAGDAKKFGDMVNAYAGNLCSNMKSALKTDALIYCGAEVVRKLADEKAQEVLKNIKADCGVENILRESNLDDAGRAMVQGALSMLESSLTSAVAGVASKAAAQIVSGISTTFDSRDQAMNAMKSPDRMPDTVNDTLNVMSKKFLTGEKWSAVNKEFTKVEGAKDHLKAIYDNFKISYQSSDSDTSANDALKEVLKDPNSQ